MLDLEFGKKISRPWIWHSNTLSGNKKNEKLIEAIINTWGNKCDGFFAASNYTNTELGILDVPHRGEESYNNMWQKVRSMWAFVYDTYIYGFLWLFSYVSSRLVYFTLFNACDFLYNTTTRPNKQSMSMFSCKFLSFYFFFEFFNSQNP